MNWINYDIANRRRYIFQVLKHVRLPLVATKLLESYVNNCTDLSVKVAMSSVKKDLISQKGSLVALYVKPRKGAKKNIYVIGGEDFAAVCSTAVPDCGVQGPRESWAVPGPAVSAHIRLWSASTLSRRSGDVWPAWTSDGECQPVGTSSMTCSGSCRE